MQTQPVIATHKLIVLIVFICAALMSSFFIYRTQQKLTVPTLAADAGSLFPVARDIKAFKLVTGNGTEFTERDFQQHWTLLFFGFTHCASVCPSTFEVLKRVYPDLHAQFPQLQVVLISVDPERDSSEALKKYTQSYHPDFLGVSGKLQEIRKLQSQLGVYSSSESTTGNYQIQHSPSILLINPKGQWAGLLRFGLKPEELTQAVKTAIIG